ncbi:hypothetical protein [Rhodovulum sp. ES.010]|uniref:hypothetical protein n=1 Tax=Rhodovulum sp. ES.010 TaxID=1882821 RepID=UPI000A68E5AE|nr:hypothetical protein [Rhodovulum sp. ES.010]
MHAPFVAEGFAGEHRVTVREGDMSRIEGPYDLIWSAGALHVLSVPGGLAAWLGALARGAAVAFFQACWFSDAPSARAKAFRRESIPT